MISPTKLFLIRHGEVETRYHKVFGGKIDMDLSPFGLRQADALADYLEKIPFHAIYSSPMRRVQQTLSTLVERQNKQPIILPELREVDFGAWTGLGWEEIRAKFGISPFDWLDQLDEGLIADAEPVADFQGRIRKAIDSILTPCAGQTVAVVCHGGVIRMLLSLLLDFPLKKMASFEVEYASISIVNHLPHRTVLDLLNYAPWQGIQ